MQAELTTVDRRPHRDCVGRVVAVDAAPALPGPNAFVRGCRDIRSNPNKQAHRVRTLGAKIEVARYILDTSE